MARLITLILVLNMTLPLMARAQEDDGLIVLDRWGFARLEDVVYGGDYDIVVATILAVDDSGATQAHPPRVTIRVREILRGSRPVGVQTIRWMPAPLFMPCDVGEEDNIRRWNAQPMKGPDVGLEMILGGEPEAALGQWGCSLFCRWAYSDELRSEVRQKVRLWKPRVEEHRRQREAQRKAEQHRLVAIRARAEADLVQQERGWLSRAEAAGRSANIEQLVRASSDIVLGELSGQPEPARLGFQVRLRVYEWMRTSGRTPAVPGTILLFLGGREDSLARQWKERPHDLIPGSRPGEAVQCVAFLRYAHDSVSYYAPAPQYRPTDGLYGLLLADSRVVRRVRETLSRRGEGEPEPRAGCGADLSEFTGLPREEAAEVGLKLTSTKPLDPYVRQNALVLGCFKTPDGTMTSLTTTWFAPCLLPDERYAQDYQSQGWDILAEPEQMKALLDSLGVMPFLRRARSSERDSMTLTIRRVREGRERIYESMLDGDDFLTLTRVLASIFKDSGAAWVNGASPKDWVARSNLANWTSTLDPRCRELWGWRPLRASGRSRR